MSLCLHRVSLSVCTSCLSIYTSCLSLCLHLVSLSLSELHFSFCLHLLSLSVCTSCPSVVSFSLCLQLKANFLGTGYELWGKSTDPSKRKGYGGDLMGLNFKQVRKGYGCDLMNGPQLQTGARA